MDTIPTAHVSPHPAAARSPVSNFHQSPVQEALPLRRAVSTNDFSDIQYSGGPHSDIDSLLQKAGGGRRWNSYQNLPVDRPASDLHQLQPDPDMTLNDTRLPEPDDIYKQKQLNSQSPIAPVSHGQATTSANEMSYSSYLSVGKDAYSQRHMVDDPRLSGDPRIPSQHQVLSYNTERQSTNYGSSNTYGPLRYHNPGGFQTPMPHGSGRGVYAQVDNYRGSSVAPVNSDNYNSDITSWQQKHQEQLRRQQYEATQVSHSRSYITETLAY